MTLFRANVACAVALILVLCGQSSSMAAVPMDPEDPFWVRSGGDSYAVGGQNGQPGMSLAISNGGSPEQFRRISLRLCGSLPRMALDGAMAQLCSDVRAVGGVAVPCAVGERRVDPLLRRVADPGRVAGWSPWNMVDVGGCVGQVDLAGAVAAEFQRLPLTASVLSVQPPSGWTLVNLDTIAFSDGVGQTLSAVVLGTSVLVRAVPVRFAWDFGDGSAPVVTTGPGAPYPDATVAHRYSAAGKHSIVLVTTWRADFQVAGTTTWEPVAGTATTTSSSGPLDVYTARARLVAEPLPN